MDVQTETDVSKYKPLDPTKQLSARIRGSVLARVDFIAELWAARAKALGDEHEGIDRTHVVETLLDDAAQSELEQFGGMPDSKEAREALLKIVTKTATRKSDS